MNMPGHGKARTRQIKDVRDTFRQNRHCTACRCVKVDPAAIVRREQRRFVVQREAAQKYACHRIREGIHRDARILSGFPSHFQHKPLLRVHRLRFTHTDAEKCGIKIKRGPIAEKSAAFDLGFGLNARALVMVIPNAPAIHWHVTNSVTGGSEIIPKCIRPSDAAGVSASDPHNGNIFGCRVVKTIGHWKSSFQTNVEKTTLRWGKYGMG